MFLPGHIGAALALLASLLSCPPDYGPPDRRELLKWIERSYESEAYQQDSLMLIDMVGDAHLIRKLDTIPAKLLSVIFCGTLPQAVLEKEKRKADPDYKTGRTAPIDCDALLLKCTEIMRGNFPAIIPVAGEEHTWSPEAEKYLRYGFWHRLGRYISGAQKDFPAPLLGRSKLFLCLACGWTSRYCVSGKESALLERLMDYPDRGVQPHHVFAESYVLNGGNLYLTFLTCENVLAGRPHRKDRENDPLQRKLSYIRNDTKEIGDNYGAWYHFFGAALYGMLRPELVSLAVTGTESLGSFFIEGPDPQERMLNRSGAIFGRRFKDLLESAGWWLLPEAGNADYLVN